MTFGIIGASGFIGREVAEKAYQAGYRVIGFSRSDREPDGIVSEWRSSGGDFDLRGIDVVVCLTGHSVDRRWTERNKRLFYESRVDVVDRVVAAMARLGRTERPKTFLSSSAVGIYGNSGDQVMTETVSPQAKGGDYLAELCRDWEAAARKAEVLDVRVALIRIGVVLGQGGAAFEKLFAVFRFGLGGRLGSGRQWMPWVHVTDLARAFIHIAGQQTLTGPVNGTAPQPERNVDLTRKMASSLKRPAIFVVPGFMLKLVLGGFGGALLAGQRAIPQALLDSGFEFSFPSLESALDDLKK